MDGYIVLTVFMLAGCIASCILIKKYYQNRVEATYQELLLKLDRAIAGKYRILLMMNPWMLQSQSV